MRTHMVVLVALFCLVVSVFAQQETEQNKDFVLHEEFAGLLFDHLELGDPGTAINQSEKTAALIELGFTPRKGYIPGQKLTFGEMAEVLIFVYSLTDKLQKDFTQQQAVDLLVDEKILPEKVDPTKLVDYNFALDVIRKIPMGPNAVPKTVLLPRIPREPPLSRLD